MRFWSAVLVLTISVFLFSSCANDAKPSTPLQTLKEYGDAFKKKDITTMKLLLSDASLKMAEQEAKAQNLTVDDIVRR